MRSACLLGLRELFEMKNVRAQCGRREMGLGIPVIPSEEVGRQVGLAVGRSRVSTCCPAAQMSGKGLCTCKPLALTTAGLLKWEVVSSELRSVSYSSRLHSGNRRTHLQDSVFPSCACHCQVVVGSPKQPMSGAYVNNG